MTASFRVRVFGLLLVASLWCASSVQGQTTAPAAAQAKKPATSPRSSGPTIVENKPSAPQVVTILHRLSGLKLLGLLGRTDQKLQAIVQLDEAFKIMGDVHTNVLAGLAINDGQTIVARLPEVEAELAPPLAPLAPTALPPGFPVPRKAAPATKPLLPTMTGELFESPDVTVVVRGGKRFRARYIGLDGVTGLSILKLEDKNFLPAIEAKAEAIAVGQRIRLFAPEPTAGTTIGGSITVRVGETDGTITNVTQVPSGGISKVKIKSARLSPANIGGIAINDAGETVGIIDAIEKGEAVILSTAQIRNAARRVLERQASVPRPWLGVSGQPIASLTPTFLLDNGWAQPEAMALTRERFGILLTAVAPNSPAAVAALRPGDVILRVNGENVQSAEDFTWFLDEAGPGGSVSFTVMHPGQSTPKALSLKLSGALGRLFWSNAVSASPPRLKVALLINHGIETVALMPAVAERLGSDGGLLVIYVQPETDAFRAGLRPGDLIEAIDGQQISVGETNLVSTPGPSHTFEVKRGRQKMTFTLVNTPK